MELSNEYRVINDGSTPFPWALTQFNQFTCAQDLREIVVCRQATSDDMCAFISNWMRYVFGHHASISVSVFEDDGYIMQVSDRFTGAVIVIDVLDIFQ